MKKIKKLIITLSLAVTLGMTYVPNLVYAMSLEGNAVTETVAMYVEESIEEFNDERIPIETVYFSVDENGEISIISGETQTCKLVEDVIIGAYTFYDDGLNGVNQEKKLTNPIN